jgi:ribosomal 30S subunit maturation factor RimM
MKVVNNKGTYGSIVDYTNNINPLLEVNYDNKTYYIPLKSDFIQSVSVKENKIYVSDRIEELII